MSNYRSQYQKYYGNINKKAFSETRVKGLGLDSNKRKSFAKNNTANRIINKITKQFIGSLCLLGILMIIKYIPLEEAQNIYTFSKASVNNNIYLKGIIMNINMEEIEVYKKKILEVIEENMNL